MLLFSHQGEIRGQEHLLKMRSEDFEELNEE